MLGLEENKRMQERAANRELAQDREDAIKTLKYTYAERSVEGVMDLLRDAGLHTKVFDYIADSVRNEN